MTRVTYKAAVEHYAADIAAAPNWQLFAVLRGEMPEKRKVVVQALKDLANDELQRRGVALPTFTAMFAMLPDGVTVATGDVVTSKAIRDES